MLTFTCSLFLALAPEPIDLDRLGLDCAPPASRPPGGRHVLVPTPHARKG